MQQPNNWQLRADEILAVLLKNDKAWSTVRFEHGVLPTDFPPGAWREAYRAITVLNMQQRPITLTEIHEASDSKVPLEWLSERAILYSQKLEHDVLAHNIQQAKLYGTIAADNQTLSYGLEKLRGVTTTEDRADIIGQVITSLGLELRGNVQDATAAAAGARFEQFMSEPPRRAMSTGISFLDIHSGGGMQHGEMWWIAAAYKMRKSTLMRVMALHMAQQGHSVAIMAREGEQKLVIAQLVAMLAVQWMITEGVYNERDKYGNPLNVITAKMLLALRNRYKTALDKRQVAAIDQGIKAYRALENSLRIYDSTPENGGLSDICSVQTLLMREKQMYGLDVAFIDYLQLLQSNRTTIYEATSHNAQTLQHEAQKHEIALCVLAQLNEATVKSDSTSYSPGVKGGGDPAATADYLLTTGYPKEADGETFDKNHLRIMLKLSRHGDSGCWEDFPIHPPTGLLLPTTPLNVPVSRTGGES